MFILGDQMPLPQGNTGKKSVMGMEKKLALEHPP